MGQYQVGRLKVNHQPVFICGGRSAFVRSFGDLEDCDALEILSRVTDGVLRKTRLDPQYIDEYIAGTVIPQTKNPNIARDTILNLGLPSHIPGYTINRSCISGLQSVLNGMASISSGHARFVLAGGVESLSDIPVVYSKEARKFLVKLAKSRSAAAKLNIIKHFRAKAWLPRQPELTEPLTGLSMGLHGELMAQKNQISRKDQDLYAVESHRRASNARKNGLFTEEIIPVWAPPEFSQAIKDDNIIIDEPALPDFKDQKPVFDKRYGTLTQTNSSPLTDGAATCLIADEASALEQGLSPSLRLLASDTVAVDPYDQLLIGPAMTIPRVLEKAGLKMQDIDRFEIHEAFSAQILSCLRSLESDAFFETHFGASKAPGSPPMDKVNVNGGAIALGHPFAATGVRMLLTLNHELLRHDLRFGIVTICSAGGMASSLLVGRYDQSGSD